MRLALHQTAGVFGDPAANLGALETTAGQATEAGAQLLVLPELWLTGYNLGDRVRELAEPAEGPSAAAVAKIARRHGLAILYGFPERDGDSVYNAAQLIDAGGLTRTCYRKAHLFGDAETRLFAAGAAAAPVVEVAGLPVAILICYDVEFPEAVRRAALDGAQALLVPTALFRPFDFVARRVVPVRAWENGVYLAYANRCGAEVDLRYVGLSTICGPDGRGLTAAGTDAGLLHADLDPGAVGAARTASPYLRDRRPEL